MIQVGDRVICTSDFDSPGASPNGHKLKGVVGVVVELTKHDARIEYPEGVWPTKPSLPINSLVLAGHEGES